MQDAGDQPSGSGDQGPSGLDRQSGGPSIPGRALQDIGLVSALLPAADAYESADEFVLELEVPGFDEQELSIEVFDHTLKISGERSETTAAGTKFRLRERLDRKFERRVDLPRDADTEHIKAVFDMGVLKVQVPKRQTVTRHMVAISKPGRPTGG